jgi:hypothetical protein
MRNPIREPFKPDYWTLSARRKQYTYDLKHPSWRDYIN